MTSTTPSLFFARLLADDVLRRPAPPPAWVKCAHPKGARYFYNDEKVRFVNWHHAFSILKIVIQKVYTDADLFDPVILCQIHRDICTIQDCPRNNEVYLPDSTVLFWMFFTPKQKPKERSQVNPRSRTPATSSFRLSTILRTTSNVSSFSWTTLKLATFMAALNYPTSPQNLIFVRNCYVDSKFLMASDRQAVKSRHNTGSSFASSLMRWSCHRRISLNFGTLPCFSLEVSLLFISDIYLRSMILDIMTSQSGFSNAPYSAEHLYKILTLSSEMESQFS